MNDAGVPRLSWRFQAGLAALVLACVLLTRLPAFFRSVLDWDESLYFLMASQWRAGHLPYTTIWDNKPLGIYAIFAVFQAVFGAQIAAMRIASVVFVSVTAVAVVNITYRMTATAGQAAKFAAVSAGLVFILGSLSNDGLAANTELFMACFTTLGVLAALPAPGSAARPWRHGLLTGLMLGAAFMVKYVAVFEAPAVAFLLVSPYRGRRLASAFTACCLGAAVPLAATVLLYAHAGLLGLWWDSAIIANLRRLAPPVPPGALAAACGLQLHRWGPLFAAGAIVEGAAAMQLWRLRRSRLRRAPLPPAPPHLFFLAAWLLGGLAGVASAKSFYDHYFLQLLPVLCVVSGWLLSRGWPRLAAWPGYRRTAVLAVWLALPAAAAYGALADAMRPLLMVQHGALLWQQDSSARIAAAINAEPASANSLNIYVFDGQPIIYALVHQAPPTRYVLPSVLTKNFLRRVAGVDAAAEVGAILDHHPVFIIRDRHPAANPKTVDQTVYIELDQTLAAHYRLWRSFGDQDVYRRLQASPGSPPVR